MGLILGPYEKDAQVWSIDKVPEDFGAELMPPDLDRVEHIIEAAMARIPALADGGIKTVVNGPITFTPDANPLVGPAARLSNAWCLTGSSMGVMEGGGAGYFLAYWMTHGSPQMDALAIDSRPVPGPIDNIGSTKPKNVLGCNLACTILMKSVPPDEIGDNHHSMM